MNKTAFSPVLLASKISHNYVNPGDAVFVTVNIYNQGQLPGPKNCRFVMDLLYGHQRKLDNKQFNYRVTAEPFPSADEWIPGMETAVTLRWELPSQWAGTYHMNLSILDEDDMPIAFFVPGYGMVKTFNIGEVNTSWGMGRPWVLENTCPVLAEYPYTKETAYKSISNSASITLTDTISVKLAQDEPKILDIDGVSLRYASPKVKLKRLSDSKIFDMVNYSLTTHTDKETVYEAIMQPEGQQAVAFCVKITLEGQVLSVTVDNIRQEEGFELLSVKYPTLVEMSTGSLLDFYGGGRLIPICEAAPIHFERPYDVRNAAAVYDQNRLFLVESTHIDSLLITGVYNQNSVNHGFVGGVITCTIPAEGNRPGIPIKTPPVFTIELCDTKGEAPDWTVAAKLLRRGVKPNNARDLYRDTYFYKQLATWGPEPQAHYRISDPHPATQNLFKTVSFAEIAENVRMFSNLTDGVKQVIYVTGFQIHGFDDAYPYPYDTDVRCGTLADLGKCLEDIRKYNGVSGLHDNFDDISSRHVDSFPHVAIDAKGNKWHGWVWPAGPTYAMSFKSYVESGDMAQRVKKMTDILPLAKSYHIDVLTAETCRYDFNPACQASAQDSYDFKMAVVKEWNNYGIDITGEMLSHPSIGHIGFALHTRLNTNEVFIPGETFVPLTHMIYHGIIGYSAPSSNIEQMLWGILLGGQTFYEADITGELCVGRFYIQNIPGMKLYDKFMTGFARSNGKARADYGEGSYVEADFEKGTYKVVVDNKLIGQNFTTFVPANTPDAYLAYAFDDVPVKYPRPFANSKQNFRAVILTTEGESEFIENGISLEGDDIVLSLPPFTPIKIYFE